MKLRVLFQNRPNAYLQPGGDTVVMDRIATELRRRGIEVVIDVAGTEDPARYSIGHLFNFALPELLRVQGERFRASRVPFVVTSLFEELPFFHDEATACAAHLIRWVSEGQRPESWRQALQRRSSGHPVTPHFDNSWVVSHADAILACSESEAEGIRTAFGRQGRIHAIPFGFDRRPSSGPNPAYQALGAPQPYVLCIGRLEHRKNQLMLLRALEHEDVAVVLAGGGFTYQDDSARAVSSFKRVGKTVVLGRLTDEELGAVCSGARVHALPSWFELPGLVSMEAGWLGCHIVAGERGSAQDYLGDTAFYCDPGNENSIRNAVFAAWHSPDEHERIRKHLDRFTWAAHAEALLAHYQAIVSKASSNQSSYSPGRSPLPMHTPAGATASPVQPMVPQQPSADRLNALLEEAEKAAKGRAFDRAHNLLDEVLALDPRSARALRVKGTILLADNKPSEGIPFFEASLKIDPRDPRALSGFGMCHVALKHFTAAYPFFVQALREEPHQMVTLLGLMECAYAIGRYDDLTDALKKHLAVHKDDKEMRYCYAAALFKLSRIPEAEREVEQVLRLDPNHRGAKELVNAIAGSKARPVGEQGRAMDVEGAIGELEGLKRTQQYTMVLERCEELLRYPLSDRSLREKILILKAESHALSGDEEDANALYSEVLDSNPQSSRALSGQGALAAYRSSWERAEILFSRARELDERNDAAWAGLGLCMRNRSDWDDAWTCFRRSLEINPENSGALYGAIEVGYHLNRLTEVEDLMHRYLELHPGDLDVQHALGECLLAQGKLAEAEECLATISLFEPGGERSRQLGVRIAESRAGSESRR